MHALETRPGTTCGTSPDPLDDASTIGPDVRRLIWRSLAGRLEHRKNLENAFMDVRPRSDEDVAHFELIWKDTGRDVYRFTAW